MLHHQRPGDNPRYYLQNATDAEVSTDRIAYGDEERMPFSKTKSATAVSKQNRFVIDRRCVTHAYNRGVRANHNSELKKQSAKLAKAVKWRSSAGQQESS